MTPIVRNIKIREGKIVHQYLLPPNTPEQEKTRFREVIFKKFLAEGETLIDLQIQNNLIEGIHAITPAHPDYFESVRFTPNWDTTKPHPKWVQPPRWLLNTEDELTAKAVILAYNALATFEEKDGCPYVIIPENPENPPENPEKERTFIQNGCGSHLFAIEWTTPSTNQTHEGFLIPHPEEHITVQKMMENLQGN